MIGILLFMLWFMPINHPDTVQPQTIKENYRAAKYSTVVDFTRIKQKAPEVLINVPLSTVSYKYIIEYGKDVVIEIIEPGEEIHPFTGCIKKLDYAKRESTFTCMIASSRTYHTSKDSIVYSIDESKGSVSNLCRGVLVNSRCDSVIFTRYNPRTEYKIIFHDTIANLRSISLLYPDIKYLPYQIVGVGPYNNTFTLEEVIYGQSSIDSLLQLYNYKGYREIRDEEIYSTAPQEILDFVEKLNCKE